MHLMEARYSGRTVLDAVQTSTDRINLMSLESKYAGNEYKLFASVEVTSVQFIKQRLYLTVVPAVPVQYVRPVQCCTVYTVHCTVPVP